LLAIYDWLVQVKCSTECLLRLDWLHELQRLERWRLRTRAAVAGAKTAWEGQASKRDRLAELRRNRPANIRRHELENLFKACRPAEQVRFKSYLMSGFRDAEGRFVTWRDVDFKHLAVRVTAKPHWRFHPKNWEEREVPVPQKLIAMLRKLRPTGPDDCYIP
jgi:integrase